MLELAAAQVRRKHAANRAGIRGVVRVPANIAIHRTNIQARAAANAVQHFPFFCVGQQAAASVIQQDNVKFFGAIGFVRALWSADKRAVSGDRLTCAGSSQHRPQRSQVFQTGNHFLNSCHGNMDARQAGAQAAIAFIGGNRDSACIGHKKVCAGNSHFRGKERLTQFAPGQRHQLLRIGVRNIFTQFFAEEVADLVAVQVHGRRYDVIRSFIAELNDKFAQVSLPNADACFFKHRRKVHLFGHHRLGFHHGFHAAAHGQVLYISTGFVAIGGPEDMSAARQDFLFKLEQVFVQMIDGFALDLLAFAPRRFPILDARASAHVRSIVAIHVLADNFAMDKVSRLGGGVAQKFLGRSKGGRRFAGRRGEWCS